MLYTSKGITSAIIIELENYNVWLQGNKLFLNISKAASTLIGTRHTINEKTTKEPLRENFEISGKPIDQKPSVKYLEVHIKIGHIKVGELKVASAIAIIKYSKKRRLTYFKDAISEVCGNSI